MAQAKRDENYVPTLLAVSNADGTTPVTLYADPVTHRLLVSSSAAGVALDDLSDVTITAISDNEVLQYDTGSGAWINQTFAEAGIQAQGDVLDDLITLGAATTDGQFIVATGAGAFAYESGATARTSLGLGSAALVATDLSDLNEATIETAIDTLPNLTSIQSLTVTLADAGANAIFGWDDAAGAYENLTQAEVLGVIGSASISAQGVVEIATGAETTTGTDATRAVSPDGLAESDYGKRVMGILVFSDAQDVATGDGAGDVFVRIPSVMNGWNLVGVAGCHQTAGTGTGTDTTDIQIHNVTQAADMLTTKLTIDEDETDSSTALAAAAIDPNNDDVATGDQIRIDVDAVTPTTAPKGLFIELTFQLP